MNTFRFERLQVADMLDFAGLQKTGVNDEFVKSYCLSGAVTKVLNKYRVLQNLMTTEICNSESLRIDADYLESMNYGV